MKVLHHRAEGAAGAPVLILGPSVGTSTRLWDQVAPELSTAHRVIRFDLPGHGGSDPSLISAGATIGDLARRVVELADSQGIEQFAYAGVSIGGAIGLWLAVHHPERISSLVVVCSSARFGAPQNWRDRAALVRSENSTASVAGTTPARWFTPAFADSGIARELVGDLRATDPTAYAACCDALAAYDLRAELGRISVPVTVIAGREDPATPPAHAREIADGIPGAALVELAGTSHLAPAENPDAVLRALYAHFGDGGRYGVRARREVLGDAHVDRAMGRTTPLTARFQDYISRAAWGEIWTDDTLARRERSMITITALIAHGHYDELAMHLRAARRNGLSWEEISAVLVQTGVYLGVPAANSAFGVAQKVRDEEER
jgi:3-oxoadipate enol-lactonase/4-carboxymuconolactone decarboxylase